MAPFWVPIIIRHLLFRVPKKGTIILTTTHLGLRGEGVESRIGLRGCVFSDSGGGGDQG